MYLVEDFRPVFEKRYVTFLCCARYYAVFHLEKENLALRHAEAPVGKIVVPGDEPVEDVFPDAYDARGAAGLDAVERAFVEIIGVV